MTVTRYDTHHLSSEFGVASFILGMEPIILFGVWRISHQNLVILVNRLLFFRLRSCSHFLWCLGFAIQLVQLAAGFSNPVTIFGGG